MAKNKRQERQKRQKHRKNKNNNKQSGGTASSATPKQSDDQNPLISPNHNDMLGRIKHLLWSGEIALRIQSTGLLETHLDNAINLIDEFISQQHYLSSDEDVKKVHLLKCRAYLMKIIGASNTEEDDYDNEDRICWATQALETVSSALSFSHKRLGLFSPEELQQLQFMQFDFQNYFLSILIFSTRDYDFISILDLIDTVINCPFESNTSCSEFIDSFSERLHQWLSNSGFENSEISEEDELIWICKMKQEIKQKLENFDEKFSVCLKDEGFKDKETAEKNEKKIKDWGNSNSVFILDNLKTFPNLKALFVDQSISDCKKILLQAIQLMKDITSFDVIAEYQRYQKLADVVILDGDFVSTMYNFSEFLKNIFTLSNQFFSDHQLLCETNNWLTEIDAHWDFMTYLSGKIETLRLISIVIQENIMQFLAIDQAGTVATELLVEESMLQNNKKVSASNKKISNDRRKSPSKALGKKECSSNTALTWALDNNITISNIEPSTSMEHQERGVKLYQDDCFRESKSCFEKANELASKSLKAFPQSDEIIKEILPVWMSSGKYYVDCIVNIANENIKSTQHHVNEKCDQQKLYKQWREDYITAIDYLKTMHVDLLAEQKRYSGLYIIEKLEHELVDKIIDLSFSLLYKQQVATALIELEKIKNLAIHGLVPNSSPPGHQKHLHWVIKVYQQRSLFLQIQANHAFNKKAHNIIEAKNKLQEALTACKKAIELVPPSEKKLLEEIKIWVQEKLEISLAKIDREIHRRIEEVASLERMKKSGKWYEGNKKTKAPRTENSYLYQNQLEILKQELDKIQHINKEVMKLSGSNCQMMGAASSSSKRNTLRCK